MLNSDEEKLVLVTEVAKSVRSRRNFFAWGIVGGLVVLSGIQINFRGRRTKRQEGVIEIPKSWFANAPDGVFSDTPERLSLPRFCGPVELFLINNFSAYSSVVPHFFGISYSFWRDENPSRRAYIEIVALNESGNVIASHGELV